MQSIQTHIQGLTPRYKTPLRHLSTKQNLAEITSLFVCRFKHLLMPNPSFISGKCKQKPPHRKEYFQNLLTKASERLLLYSISSPDFKALFTYYFEVKWSESCSVVSDSLWPHGLYSPWNSPGQNTGVGSLSLLQGIFPTQGSNPGLPHCRQILYRAIREAQGRFSYSKVSFLSRAYCIFI